MSSQPELAVGPGSPLNYQPIKVDAAGNLLVAEGETPFLAPAGFTKVEVTTFATDGSPTTLVYSQGATVLVTWHLTYNAAGKFQKAEKA